MVDYQVYITLSGGFFMTVQADNAQEAEEIVENTLNDDGVAESLELSQLLGSNFVGYDIGRARLVKDD